MTSTQPMADIDAIITHIVKNETNSLLLNLKKKEELLDQRLETVGNLQELLNRLETKFTLTVGTIHTELHVLQTELHEQTQRAAEHLKTVENRCTDIEHKLTTTDLDSIKTQIASIQTHTNKLILKLKLKQKHMLNQLTMTLKCLVIGFFDLKTVWLS